MRRYSFWLMGIIGCQPSAAEPPARTSNTETETQVTVTSDGLEPNAFCIRYCERVASCAYAMRNVADPTMSDAEMVASCREESNDCRLPTLDTHCCTSEPDCQAFAECSDRSKGVPSDCGQAEP